MSASGPRPQRCRSCCLAVTDFGTARRICFVLIIAIPAKFHVSSGRHTRDDGDFIIAYAVCVLITIRLRVEAHRGCRRNCYRDRHKFR